jgi:hypothetical protein
MSLRRYKVTYFYLATGQEGRADERDYGEYVAPSARAAKAQAIDRHDGHLSKEVQDWVLTCLTATEIKTN